MCPKASFIAVMMWCLQLNAQAAKGVKAYDKAEDPIYALEHNLPIDFQHYLDHHLEQPLQRLFAPMMNNPKELMCGECPVVPP